MPALDASRNTSRDWGLAIGISLAAVALTIVVMHQLQPRRSHRYEFTSAGGLTVARLDRYTGEIIFISPAGKEVGRWSPSKFDPFKSGQAVEEKSP